ncbi:sec1 family domain-containing protein 1-like [Oscarella lobularis]|uniref:sec1 family domain-containing protein 1-like n=1 Tax=Oscarella lobularis TaxID=121494 RepID=UPI003313DA8E
MISLKERQKETIKAMLSLGGSQKHDPKADSPTWKVLVFDKYGQNIVSPIVNVPELRDLGVTLHLPLHSDRDSVPDAPAVYFVMPTPANVARICQDFRNQVYDSYHLNFISPVSRDQIEELAGAAIEAGSAAQVGKVFDQYLNFISLEKDLFLMRQQDREEVSYLALNKPTVTDTEVMAIVNSIVDSLFSVFVTLGAVPIIRCPRGNAAEMVSEELDKKLRENLRNASTSLFNPELAFSRGRMSFQRPLLVVLDRGIDLATSLHHTWTYQALVHDLLDFKLNRVTIKEAEAAGAGAKDKMKSYEVDVDSKFWHAHKGSPFPTVAEAVQNELDQYRASEEEVKRLKGVMGLEDSASDAEISVALSENTAKLTSAVSSLPELLERKKMIDMHTNIATALLEEIKGRKLDFFFEMEEKIMAKSSLDKPLLDIISDPETGSCADKLRLFLIHYLVSPDMSSSDLEKYVKALQEAGADTAAVDYLKKWKIYQKMSSAEPGSRSSGGTTAMRMFSKLMTTGSKFVMEGVKNLVIGERHLPVTRVVDALMEAKGTPEVENYRYFDPKLLRTTETAAPKNASTFSEALVFVVGGGNLIEYLNLSSYAKKQPSGKKTITYGATEMPTPAEFIEQLARLGRIDAS